MCTADGKGGWLDPKGIAHTPLVRSNCDYHSFRLKAEGDERSVLIIPLECEKFEL